MLDNKIKQERGSRSSEALLFVHNVRSAEVVQCGSDWLWPGVWRREAASGYVFVYVRYWEDDDYRQNNVTGACQPSLLGVLQAQRLLTTDRQLSVILPAKNENTVLRQHS